jgi:menaquinol-cytochrome c reductase iron-sulfur subunit
VPDAPDSDRRKVLKAMAAAGGAASVACGALAVPSVRFLIAPASGAGGGGRWIKTVALEALREGEPKRVPLVSDHRDAWTLEKDVQLGAAWLLRKGDAVVAYSTTCPHLGCAVDRASSGPGFYCPCHDSSFDAAGGRLSGPSPRALDELETRIEGGVVSVNFKRFRQGIPDKVSVG